MLKIGDFSKLSQVSVKALRLYDQMGLLKPAHVDDQNGYRYYSAEQLPRLNRILAFKDLGFSLEQISQLLDEQASIVQIRSMLRLKQAELQNHIQAERERLARVEARLQQIEQENQMRTQDVVIKKLEPAIVVSIREILPNYSQIGQLYSPLFDYLEQQKIKPGYCGSIWHDMDYKESDVDGEAVIFIQSSPPVTEPLKVYELPSYEQAACIVHQGSFRTITQSYGHLLNWIEQHGYQIIDSNREIYIQGGSELELDNESYVTEIQFPIIKQ
ncbi:MAG: MerR family transcriptional regulator [Cyanobacteria bacterium J06592_8]